MRSIPQVGLVGSMFRCYGNDAIRGIEEYARRFGPWQFSMKWLRVGVVSLRHPDLFASDSAAALRDLDGILYHKDFAQDDVMRIPSGIGVPIVSIQQYTTTVTPWQVVPDHRAIGRMAGNEFVNTGFKHLAYCPLLNLKTAGDSSGWDRQRRNGLGEAARKARAQLHVYPHSPGGWAQFSAEIEQGRLARWLRDLPKPAGLLAACDERARHVLLSALSAGVKVPEEVAVIGVDNEPWAGIAPLGLSSIEPDAFRAGYVAAGMLDALMQGQSLPKEVVRIPPLRIVARQTTTAIAIEDPEVITALRFIAKNAKSPIAVQDVVDAVVISRRGLERRFQRSLHHSIQEEIRRAHLNRAKALLEDDEIPMSRVAAMSGFITARAMDALFTRTLGMTPAAYRKRTAFKNDRPDLRSEAPPSIHARRSPNDAAELAHNTRRLKIPSRIGAST